MRRVVLVLSIAAALVFMILVAGASLLGAAVPAHMLTAISQDANNQPRETFIDVGRALTVSFLPRLDVEILDIQLDDAHHAFMLTQREATPEGVRTVDLHYVDLRDRKWANTPLLTMPGILPFEQASVSYFGAQWSPDRSLLSYYHVVDGTSNIYDTRTRQSHVVVEDVNSGYFRGGVRWSPDGRQLAFAVDRDTLLIVNADGSNQRRFDLSDIESFLVTWSADSQHMLISHFNRRNAPLRVLDVQTMQVNTDIAFHWGSHATWCDDRWIAFIRHQPNGHDLPYMLDTQRSIEYNLGRNGALSERTAQFLSFDTACEHIFLVMNQTTTRSSHPSIYVANLTGSRIELLSDRVRTWAGAEHISAQQVATVTYSVPETDGSYSIYRAALDDMAAHELLVNFEPTPELNASALSPRWIENTDYGLLYVPGALYRIDRHGLRQLFRHGGGSFQYSLWLDS